MSFPHYDRVELAYRELVDQGKIARRDNQEAVEQDKGLLTRRAAYYANLVDPSMGILEKTSGNQSMGYSVDIIIAKDGTFWDIATDRDGMAQTVDGGPSVDPGLAARWRQPTAALAGLDQPQPEPGPEPQPEPQPQPEPLPQQGRVIELLEHIAKACEREANETAQMRAEVVEALDKSRADIVKAIKAFRLWTPAPKPKRSRK